MKNEDQGRSWTAKNSSPGDSRSGHILLKGGCVLSLDASVGDFDTADVLIDGSEIVALEPNLKAAVAVIDASNMTSPISTAAISAISAIHPSCKKAASLPKSTSSKTAVDLTHS